MADNTNTTKGNRVGAVLLLLARVHLDGEASLAVLMEVVGASRAAVFRLLAIAKNDLHVEIESVRGVGYRVRSWGVLDERALAANYGKQAARQPGRKRVRKADAASKKR